LIREMRERALEKENEGYNQAFLGEKQRFLVVGPRTMASAAE
jgi:hypothetical protein